jgi:hypothetical protein
MKMSQVAPAPTYGTASGNQLAPLIGAVAAKSAPVAVRYTPTMAVLAVTRATNSVVAAANLASNVKPVEGSGMGITVAISGCLVAGTRRTDSALALWPQSEQKPHDESLHRSGKASNL